MDPFLDNFDDFVDDIISSDLDLLKGELDYLIIQHLFHSIDLNTIKNQEYYDEDSLAA